MQKGSKLLAGYGTTIFEVMSSLSVEHDAINLGQGFPDDEGPELVRKAAAEATMQGPNQYPPMHGLPVLRQALAEHNKRFYGLDIDWKTETLVTSGATEALTASILALINPGDEAIVFEPLYDTYVPAIRLAGGTVKTVRLEPPRWDIDFDALAAAFSDKTKLILFNTPMNPTGKVFTREELGKIADLVEKHDVYAICDEVYEHLVFDGLKHIPLMTLPGMRERTIRIGSAGKTFSLTGWKVGYVTAAPDLLALVAKAHQYLTFTTPPNLQIGVAAGFAQDDNYFKGLAEDLQAKRDVLQAGFERLGWSTLPCHATYFLTVDIRELGYNGTDLEFCKEITRDAHVSAIPLSALYDSEPPNNLIRFCFAKDPAVLNEAVERLRSWLENKR